MKKSISINDNIIEFNDNYKLEKLTIQTLIAFIILLSMVLFSFEMTNSVQIIICVLIISLTYIVFEHNKREYTDKIDIKDVKQIKINKNIFGRSVLNIINNNGKKKIFSFSSNDFPISDFIEEVSKKNLNITINDRVDL